jgi:hypothetical protein
MAGETIEVNRLLKKKSYINIVKPVCGMIRYTYAAISTIRSFWKFNTKIRMEKLHKLPSIITPLENEKVKNLISVTSHWSFRQ